MMRLLLFLIMIVFLSISCNKPVYNLVQDFGDQKYIKFGKQGGYTNINTEFYVDEKGSIYRKSAMSDTIELIGEFEKKEFKAIKKELKNKTNYEQKFIPKSTLYYYLEWMEDSTKTKQLVWPMGTVADSLFRQIHVHTFGIKETTK